MGRKGPPNKAGRMRAPTFRPQYLVLPMAVFAATLTLTACTAPEIPADAPPGTGIRLVADRNGKAPTNGPKGACWQDAITPAVIETVTEQVLLEPERRNEAGTVIAPAVYGSQTHQRLVADRSRVWFRAPCPIELTVNYVASVQRALKARGYLSGDVTGELDAPTRDAIRRFQAERGLDSPLLSLEAARELGIAAIDLG
jgi:hypothetical protein